MHTGTVYTVPMIRAVLLLLLFVSAALPAAAQGLPGAEPLSVTLVPQYPRPYQNITVAPRSTLVDLSSSKVEILVNGTVIYTGSGTQPATARAGALGERTTILVRVTDPGGRVYSVQKVVRPAEVSLILEPVSTVHPFYAGGGLVASEGRVRLVAVPDLHTDAGTRLPASSLVYTWRVADRILTDSSGIGRSTLVANAPVRHRNADITVTVTSPDSSLVGEAKTTIAAVDPFVRLYRNDPLLGPDFDTALTGRFTMPDTEATFRAVAYFFAAPPTLSWVVNGSAGGGDKDVTVRATGNGSGTAQLQLSASDKAHYQFADTRLSVGFGQGGGLGIFGL